MHEIEGGSPRLSDSRNCNFYWCLIDLKLKRQVSHKQNTHSKMIDILNDSLLSEKVHIDIEKCLVVAECYNFSVVALHRSVVARKKLARASFK